MKKSFIIAEAGSNHNGSIDRALQLIDVAKSSNASSIKFQFIYAEGLYLKTFNRSDNKISEVYKVRKSEEFTKSEWLEIWNYAYSLSIDISASVFCRKGARLLKELGTSYVKISSSDLTNIPLIKYVCTLFDEVIISTGMSSFDEILFTVNYIKSNFNVKLKLMHCVSRYPCPLTSSKLNRIKMLINVFPDIEVGYSDHTGCNISSMLAWSLGVRLYEKHMTTDKSLPGFDHAHALSPSEFSDYVKSLNDCNNIFDWDINSIDKYENQTKERARRGVYLNKDLKKGSVIKLNDLKIVRPSTRFDPKDLNDLIGKKIVQDLKCNDPIDLNDSLTLGVSNWDAANKFWANEMNEKKMS